MFSNKATVRIDQIDSFKIVMYIRRFIENGSTQTLEICSSSLFATVVHEIES